MTLIIFHVFRSRLFTLAWLKVASFIVTHTVREKKFIIFINMRILKSFFEVDNNFMKKR
jgi:hypothetical protein